MAFAVFKTGGRQVFLPPVGSTPTRFRHFYPSKTSINSALGQVQEV